MKSQQLVLDEIKKNKILFLKVSVFMLFGGMLSSAVPMLIKKIADFDEEFRLMTLVFIALGLTVSGFVSYFMNYFADKYYYLIMDKLGSSILKSFLEKILCARKKNFEETGSDALLRISTTDIDKLKFNILKQSLIIISTVTNIVTLFFFVILLDYKLALITIVWYTVFFFLSKKLVDKIGKSRLEERTKYTKVLSVIKNALYGLFDFKYFASKKGYFKVYDETYNNYIKSDVDTMLQGSLFRYLGSIGNFTCIAIILLYKFIFAKDTSTGTLLAMYMYSQNYSSIFDNILYVRSLTKDIEAVQKPIDEFLSKIEGSSQDDEEISSIESIALENLSIAFKDKAVINGLNQEFSSGNAYLIEGKSGTGKTSLLNAILNEIKYGGKILCNGSDIEKINAVSYESRIGAVLQDVFLIAGSIKDNILLYRQDYDEKKLAEIADFLNLGNIDRSIGSSEIETISGGEKKRIALARLLLQIEDKDLIILDETFANIDFPTSKKILDQLLPSIDKKIFIMVTHEQQIKDYMKDHGAKTIILEPINKAV